MTGSHVISGTLAYGGPLADFPIPRRAVSVSRRHLVYLLSGYTVRRPVSNGITKRGSGQSSQEVCPWNGPEFVQITREEGFWPREGVHGAELMELMGMDQAEFSRRFKGSPVKRAKRRGLLRNVAVALGNWGAPEAGPALARALNDDEPLIRGHAAWALGRIGTPEASAALRSRERVEGDEWVREEIALAGASSDYPSPDAAAFISGIKPGGYRSARCPPPVRSAAALRTSRRHHRPPPPPSP
jgi:hypothetical protein